MRALAQLREWERAEREGKAPDPDECMGGTELRAYALASKAYPYPLRRPAGNELGELVLRDRHLTALAWVLAVELGFRREALLITHADMATLLGCSERTAGTTMRYLAQLGLVVALPMFIPGGCGHAQLACAYRVGAAAWKLFDLRRPEGGGKNCQPSEIPASPDPESVVSAVADGSIVETDAPAPVSHDTPPVKPRTATPRGSEQEGEAKRGAPQLARMLSRELAAHQQRIERECRRKYRHAVTQLSYTRAAAAPPPSDAPPPPVLDLGELHPDDAAWIASRAPGTGAAPKKTAADDERELAELAAAALASWEQRFGGRS